MYSTMHDSPAPNQAHDQFAVSVANRQSRHAVNEPELVAAVQCVLNDSKFSSSNVSIAVVDDATIHELNRRYLEHDWPTDVLSFVLEEEGEHLEGEIIVSADTAAASAAEFGWSPAAELLLYVLHGALHLVGYCDKSPEEGRQMRTAEAHYLRQFGLNEPRASSGNSRAKRNLRLPTRHGATL